MTAATSGRLRRGIAALLALLVLVVASACSGGAGPPPDTVVAPSLDELSDAIDLVNQGRATAQERARKVTAGLELRDSVDALAAQGDRSGARQADPPADAAMAGSLGALNDLGPALAAYQQGIDDLARSAASTELTVEQRRLLGTVVAAARAEISATRSLAAEIRAALPSYDALAAHLDEWLRRARAGWYRDRTEAANAYAVLVGSTRERLDRVRQTIARADTDRAAAAGRTTAALRAARRGLDPLTTRPTEVVLSPSELAG